MVFPTTGVLDVFTRADGPLIAGSANYVLLGGGDTFDVVSNQLQSPTGVESYSTFGWVGSGGPTGPDQEVWAEIVTLGGASNNLSFILRNVSNLDYYTFNAQGGTSELAVAVGSVETRLGASFSIGVSAGDAFGMRAIGNQIEYWERRVGVWTLVAERTDTTYPSQVGVVGIYAGLTTPEWVLDDFSGGDVRYKTLRKRSRGWAVRRV